jgi:dipeptidyl aminopeptidase/acylaminoacyl peptidase
MMQRITFLCGTSAPLISSLAFAQTRPIAPEDVYRLKTVADPQLSPDGTTVAYVVTSIDPPKNRRVSAIWSVANGTSAPKPFISDVPALAPRWPDGKWLAFVTNSAASAGSGTGGPLDGKNQVWVVGCDGSGRRRLITHFSGGAAGHSWSPDGTQLAMVAKQAAKARDFRRYSTVLYKTDGGGWTDESRGVDGTRRGVVVHGYDGFMTDWIVTQTNLFKAAIAISGISDFISVEGTRDAAYGHSRDFGGDLFEAFDTFWKYSPMRLAAKVRTPILFLHGEADQRVPVSQAEEFFRPTKHFGGTAELVIFPRKTRMLPLTAEPRQLVETYQWRVYWFDRWVKGETSAVEPRTE